MAGTSKLLSPEAKNPAKLNFCADCRLWLDFSGLSSMFRATFGKSGRPMRNIITKLLIVVVPRRTAGGG